MTTKPKIVILLPDAIGLRNFAYSEFHAMGEKENFELVFWNNTTNIFKYKRYYYFAKAYKFF